ncbi:hypothetical protein HDE78_000855 [Rhodanobacter sp. K2T2]|nr:hypothetical protein [Rhodanobacter sp. K2T2]
MVLHLVRCVPWCNTQAYSDKPYPVTVLIEHRRPPDMSATSHPAPATGSVPGAAAADSAGIRRPSRAHSAFWVMTRRVTVLAASVDAAFLVFFLVEGSPLLV